MIDVSARMMIASSLNVHVHEQEKKSLIRIKATTNKDGDLRGVIIYAVNLELMIQKSSN
jgi:hypothetical protein